MLPANFVQLKALPLAVAKLIADHFLLNTVKPELAATVAPVPQLKKAALVANSRYKQVGIHDNFFTLWWKFHP